MPAFDVPEAALDLMLMFINQPNKMFFNSSRVKTPDAIPISGDQPTPEVQHFLGGFFIILMLTAAIFAGLFIKKKLRKRRSEWYHALNRNLLPADEIELVNQGPSDFGAESTLLPRNATRRHDDED